MRHGHHHHIDPSSGDRKVLLAIGVNMALTVAQVVGGIFAGSLALIADALHNFSDAIALVIAFVARRIARRPADADMTFGYRRAEIVAALVNYTTLVLLGLYLLYEAALRVFNPQDVDGWLVVVIAGFALVVDLVTALLTYRMSKSSVNIRAAFLHNLADALGSVAVIVAGTLILLYDWRLIDPIITAMIAGYILWQSLVEIGPVIRILMLASPRRLDADEVRAGLEDIDGVESVHLLRVWQLDEHETLVDGHVVIHQDHWDRADIIKAEIREKLRDGSDVHHATLELERSPHKCTDAAVFGL